MKGRLFILAVVVLLMVLLTVELVLRRGALPTATFSATPGLNTAASGGASFEKFPTHVDLAVSPTSIPLEATLPSRASETPALLDTPTLLTVNTSTLLPLTTPQPILPSQTPVFVPSATPIRLDGSATPPMPLAYSQDGKPQTCYKGPSLAYIKADDFVVARIAGKDRSGAWWYLAVYRGNGREINCWVSDEQIETAGNLAALSVVEPELSQITLIKLAAPGPLESNGEYIATILCDDGATSTTLRFSAQIFSTGPLSSVGYRWDTDAPVSFKAERGSIESWDVPAQTALDFPIPSMEGRYLLSLRTTFPVEVFSGLYVVVKCR
jgi:hypothetical protein